MFFRYLCTLILPKYEDLFSNIDTLSGEESKTTTHDNFLSPFWYLPGSEVLPIVYYENLVSAPPGLKGAIISGFMYRGCEFPDFNGWLFIGDFIFG